MIQIKAYSNEYYEHVSRLCISQEQEQFAGTANDFLETTKQGMHQKIIFHNNLLIGVFNIDTIYSQNYSFAGTNSLGLRALFIDESHQGKGYGVLSMLALKSYLQTEYTDYQTLYLTVNCRNPAARNCYLKANFIDNGELYYGGAAGPQHIMYLRLKT